MLPRSLRRSGFNLLTRSSVDSPIRQPRHHLLLTQTHQSLSLRPQLKAMYHNFSFIGPYSREVTALDLQRGGVKDRFFLPHKDPSSWSIRDLHECWCLNETYRMRIRAPRNIPHFCSPIRGAYVVDTWICMRQQSDVQNFRSAGDGRQIWLQVFRETAYKLFIWCVIYFLLVVNKGGVKGRTDLSAIWSNAMHVASGCSLYWPSR